jgi:hypothetical protein
MGAFGDAFACLLYVIRFCSVQEFVDASIRALVAFLCCRVVCFVQRSRLMLSTRELSCYCFFGTQELAIKVFYPCGDHDISEVQNVGVIVSMMESCMPAESDLPAWYIQWVRYRRV